jgi:hypothetical protein
MDPMIRRIALIVLVLTALATLPGCPKFVLRMFKTKPDVTLPSNMPEDFRFTVQVRDAKDPDMDYTLRILNRMGDSKYDIEFRAPVRRRKPGELQLDEAALERLWTALKEVRFHELDDEYDESDYPLARNAGVRKFYVRSGGLEKQVESKYVMPPPIRKLAIAVIQTFPADLLKPVGRNAGKLPSGVPNSFLGDKSKRLFHSPDCPQCASIPENDRQPFPSVYEALNFKYSPCRECNPMYVSPDE